MNVEKPCRWWREPRCYGNEANPQTYLRCCILLPVNLAPHSKSFHYFPTAIGNHPNKFLLTILLHRLQIIISFANIQNAYYQSKLFQKNAYCISIPRLLLPHDKKEFRDFWCYYHTLIVSNRLWRKKKGWHKNVTPAGSFLWAIEGMLIRFPPPEWSLFSR